MFINNFKKCIKKLIFLFLLTQFSVIKNSELDYLEITDEVVLQNTPEIKTNFEENRDTNKEKMKDDSNDIEKLFMSKIESYNLEHENLDKKVNLGLFDTQECLFDKSQSKGILTKNGFPDKPVNENTRFILGKCNPVVFIPGIYSTRLMLTINCKKFTEKKDNLVNLRLFCGDTLCNGVQETEEHVIFPALFDSPFEFFVGKKNMYSACFGYFFKYHKVNECPTVKVDEQMKIFLVENKEESICLHDDAVKITFFGGTEKTQSKSQCGLNALKSIMSVGSRPLPESLVNKGDLLVFQAMHDRYYEMGYRSGFSMAGVPYDFRRFIVTNELFKNVFKSQIERLYENTGKPVIIIAHSFGCLNSLNQIIQSEPELLKKIKKFIAVGPPFAGVPKEVELFLHGSNEFSTKLSFKSHDLLKVELNEFGQKLCLAETPSIYELRPNPIFSKIFNEDKYKDFKKAIEERLSLEKECGTHDCETDYLESNSQAFNKIFPQFPKLSSPECQVRDLLGHKKYLQLLSDYSSNKDLHTPIFLPCRNDIYNTVSCPTVKFRSNLDEDSSIIEAKHCHTNATLTDNEDVFNHQCDITKNCLDKFFLQNYPYPYLDEKMIKLFDRFYLKYSAEFPEVILHRTTHSDSRELLRRKIDKMIKYHGDSSIIKNLEIPKIDTMIIYGSYLPTKTAYIFDKEKNIESFDKLDILMKGGDGAVPSWSSLLIGLKWLFDKKSENLDTKIQLVEYCSTLGKKDSPFNYDSYNPDKEFMAIPCDCLDSENFYDFKKTSSNTCEHGAMLTDFHVIKFIENYLKDENNTKYYQLYSTDIKESPIVPISINKAISGYKAEQNYENVCNEILRQIVDGDL